MEGRLSGQAALVTGASSGLGRAAALELAREGAAVALLARDVTSLQQVSSEIARLGVRALPLRADLADEESLTAAVGQASSLPLTILVNAAGTDVPGPAADLSTSDWDRVLAVNLRAPFILAPTRAMLVSVPATLVDVDRDRLPCCGGSGGPEHLLRHVPDRVVVVKAPADHFTSL